MKISITIDNIQIMIQYIVVPCSTVLYYQDMEAKKGWFASNTPCLKAFIHTQ